MSYLDALTKAYHEACAEGFTIINRARLNLVGHDGAGKTSFFNRLMGEEMNIDEESTEGIATHLIKSSFNKSDLMQAADWNEVSLDVTEIVKDFNDQVLSLVETKYSPEGSSSLRTRIQRKLFGRIKVEHKKSDQKNSEEKGILQTPDKSQESIEDEKLTINEHTKQPQGKQGEKAQIDKKTMDQLLKHQKSSSNDTEYFLRVWDFGGQVEFYTTHHMFLNADTMNLIVMDISKDLKRTLHDMGAELNMPGIPKTPLEFFHYWLSTIYSDASQENLQPSVALILTHKDEIPVTNTKKYIEEYVENVLQSLHQKTYSSFISRGNIFVVDNKHGEDYEFRKVRGQILQKITEQKSWGTKKPVKWLKLEADIVEKSQEEAVGYFQRELIEYLAESYNVNDIELEAFLQFHNQLGDFVYFNDPALRDVVITNPQWLVDKFKALITPHQFVERRNLEPELVEMLKQGIISNQQLRALWGTNDVSFLAELFVKFNLMLPLGSSAERRTFLIPCMLPPQDMSMYETDTYKNMELVYNAKHKPKSTEVLPVGVFHKCLSLCSKNPSWDICANDHLSNTDASYNIEDGVRLALTLLKNSDLRSSIWCSREAMKEDTRSLIIKTRMILSKSLKSLNISPGEKFIMLCPHWMAEDNFECLVDVKEKLNEQDGTWSYETQYQKCTSHKKILMQSHFTWTELLTGKFKINSILILHEQ